MKQILVATDFSARSDRALRRATLLARNLGGSLTIVHVVDDDQPVRLAEVERVAALSLLDEQVATLREVDGISCEPRVLLGDAFDGIVRAAQEIAPTLLVIGPHRRRILKDVFVGTTAERTIRAGSCPVIMANGVPVGDYRRILVAVDFSACAREALRTVRELGLDRQASVSVVHAFDAPGVGLMTAEQSRNQIGEYQRLAANALDALLDDVSFEPLHRIVRRGDGLPAPVIGAVAQELSADLIVVGTQGRSAVERFFLGSVAERVLGSADCDVLAVPPARSAQAA